ncbi:er big1 [Trichoderma cornu-damae]|uniref:Protein BIG1 n=1 Tax=Trichoderma cornu-damae TaxID=654480 RepID=A0A9P8TVS2_9HYPO|nr:er big1 [Trichoderma cornu-damae]
MRFQAIASVLPLSGAVNAFTDSSPWVFLSTSPFAKALSADQIQSSSSVLSYTKDVLSVCPTDRYLIVSQPGLNAADLRGSNGCAMPHLCQAVEDRRVNGKAIVSEVIGDLSDADLSDYIKSVCAKKDKTVTVDEVHLTALSLEDKAGSFSANAYSIIDDTLAQSLEKATAGDSYTIVFFSTPHEPTYEPHFVEPIRMELKRHVESTQLQQRDNKTDWDKLPLFEKYQFFTPGIFMGIITAIVLLSILSVGLRALGSLEVSYGAFEKDMGPAVQKKN